MPTVLPTGYLSINPISLALLAFFFIPDGPIVGYFRSSNLGLFKVNGKLYSDLVYPSLANLFLLLLHPT